MKLVLVHGRAQEHKDRVALQKEWMDALAYGLARANATLPRGTTVELPYYGDRLAELVEQVNTPLTSDVNAKGTDTDEDTLRGEMLEDIALGLGLTRADIDRELAGDVRERGPQNWRWVQAILRALDRVPGLNTEVIDLVTRDVYVYLSFPGVRAEIDRLVADAIGSGPCVVLAHSLGTVVAYNVLGARQAAPPFPRFVTVGSPLAVNAIKAHLAKPLRMPPCIKHWFNAYDTRDVVALNALDDSGFPIAPPIENKGDVANFTENRHGIAGYLADPVVAAKVVELLV
jgi:hypothetical protein